MGVEIVDLVGIDAGAAQRLDHAAARAVHVGRSHMVSVGAHPEADKLGVDARAALPGTLIVLKHQHAGTLAHHEAVAVAVPGAAGGGRIVVARGQRLHRVEATDAQRRDSRLGAAGHHHVGISMLDQPACQADRVQARGAGGDHRQVGAAQAEHDR